MIATGASSTATITLANGARITLAPNACVTLNERAAGWRSHRAARLSRASPQIAGVVRNLGLRMLSLAVFAYAILRDLEQARALTTDDDTITTRDSPYGTFEIVTKSGTVVIADDPGLTYIVDDDGSVERRVNSSARMEELQAAQQAVMGTFSLGFAGGPGSGSAPDTILPEEFQPLVIPINLLPLDPVPERVQGFLLNPVEFRPVETPPPPPPKVILPAITAFTFDSGVDGDRITNNNNLVLFGTASPGTNVAIYDAGILLGSATADANGVWRFTTGPLSDGEHAFVAAIATSSDNAAARSSLSAFSTLSALAVAATQIVSPNSRAFVVVIDTQPPDPPVVSVLSDVPQGKPTGDNAPILVIDAEAGSTVQIYQNGTLVGTATETGTPGIFTFAPGVLADGGYRFTATATDLAGNTSAASCDVTVQIDTTPPSAPVFVELADASCCAGLNLTGDTTPTLVIAAEAGSTVTVYRDGAFAGLAAETKTPGLFAFTSSALTDGRHSFTATATDSAGNHSPLSDSFTIRLITSDPNDFDEKAAGKRIAYDCDGTVFGTRADDFIWFKSDKHEPGRTIFAGAGDDDVKGTGRDDVIYGGSGNDKIYGNSGNDTIFGGLGNDRISGGNGDDIISGGYGADILSGGKGCDTFVFLSDIDSLPCARDFVTDFDAIYDKIDLSAIDGGAADRSFLFAGQTDSRTVLEHSVTWYYDRKSDNTYIVADTDGDTGAAEIEIVLAGRVNLTSDNFILHA
ncbi:Ig-like domain-containing protein [Pseudorhodoplanes sp.]|uniref:Ig-like domain-containing protein n=1 Tax=Pseudorhodoplanes sp. TaxID=1934341 RepID=UPI003919985F